MTNRAALVLSAATVLVAAARATAVDVSWLNPAGGTYADGLNWSGGAAPSSTQNGLFNLNATYNVNLSGDHEVRGMIFRQGHVTFGMASRSLNCGAAELGGVPGNIIVG